MRDPVWYNALTTALSDEQRKNIQEIFVLADQRLAAAGKETAFRTFFLAFRTVLVSFFFFVFLS